MSDGVKEPAESGFAVCIRAHCVCAPVQRTGSVACRLRGCALVEASTNDCAEKGSVLQTAFYPFALRRLRPWRNNNANHLACIMFPLLADHARNLLPNVPLNPDLRHTTVSCDRQGGAAWAAGWGQPARQGHARRGRLPATSAGLRHPQRNQNLPDAQLPTMSCKGGTQWHGPCATCSAGRCSLHPLSSCS